MIGDSDGLADDDDEKEAKGKKLIKLQWRSGYERKQKEEELRITKCHSLVLRNAFISR